MPKPSRSIARQTRREHRGKAAPVVDQKQEANFNRAPVRATLAPIIPLNETQRLYFASIRTQRITFGIGSAGTGKTWVAAGLAADALREGLIERIVLTRPAVEAGEKLGFLPGDLKEKYEPYLAPFIDALEERLGTGHLEYLLRKKIIDPRPLGFMRGMTMKNAWVLADEAQNISKVQMKMLLSRIGSGSKFIVTGDPRQTDLNPGQSGLEDAVDRLSGIDGITTVRFGIHDIVRDDICQAIISRYEK